MSEDTYHVEFTRTAHKQLAKLDRTTQVRVLKATSLLALHPRPPSAKRLRSSLELWRIRVGDYRVIYEIDGSNIVISVARVGHRSSVYRNLDDL